LFCSVEREKVEARGGAAHRQTNTTNAIHSHRESWLVGAEEKQTEANQSNSCLGSTSYQSHHVLLNTFISVAAFLLLQQQQPSIKSIINPTNFLVWD